MAQLNDTMVQGDLRVTGSIYGNISGNAATATSAGKLTTARKTYVTLGTASTTTTRDWSGDTTIPVSGTLAISNGGTGATQVTGSSGALHNLTNDQIGTASQWFLTITNGWERCGYCSVADAKKVLGLGSAAYTASTAYAPSSTVSCTTANVKSALGTGSGTSKYLREDGTWQTPPDHTYTVNNAALKIQINGGTATSKFTANASSDATLAFATGSTNGTIKVDSTEVAVKGLGSAAYTASTAYAPSSTVSCTVASVRANLGVNASSGSTAKCLTEKGTWASFTNNAGTVTSVKVGSTSYSPSSGVVSLPAYPTTLPASDVSRWAKAASKPTYTASEVGAAPSSTVSCTTANVKSALGTGTGTAKYLREDGSWQIPPDTNTWRGIQDNLTSDSTTDSLSAAQGKKLNTNKLDKTTNLASSGTISETDIMAVNGSTDGFKMSYSATSSDLGKMKLHTIDDANAILSLGNTVSGSYKEAITIVNGSASITGSLTGNVTGNCSGSSGSCTGNAATATTATNYASSGGIATALSGKASTGHNHDSTYMKTTSGNKILSLGLATIIGTVNGSNVKLVMPEANADVFEVNANFTSFSDVLDAYNAHKKLILQIGFDMPGTLTAIYNIPLNRIVYSDDTPVIFVWVYTQDGLTGDTNRGVITTWSLGSTGWASDDQYTYYSDTAGLCEKASALIDFGDTNRMTRVGWGGNSIDHVIASGSSMSLSESSYLAGYYVADGMGHVKDVKAENVTVGNATKWNGWSIVVGSTGTDANTLYFV